MIKELTHNWIFFDGNSQVAVEDYRNTVEIIKCKIDRCNSVLM